MILDFNPQLTEYPESHMDTAGMWRETAEE